MRDYNCSLPRMRTLPEAAKELKAEDPNTCLTLPVLRRLVKEGVVPCVYSGKRALVDMATLNEYFKQHVEQTRPSPIRRVKE